MLEHNLATVAGVEDGTNVVTIHTLVYSDEASP